MAATVDSSRKPAEVQLMFFFFFFFFFFVSQFLRIQISYLSTFLSPPTPPYPSQFSAVFIMQSTVIRTAAVPEVVPLVSPFLTSCTLFKS